MRLMTRASGLPLVWLGQLLEGHSDTQVSIVEMLKTVVRRSTLGPGGHGMLDWVDIFSDF